VPLLGQLRILTFHNNLDEHVADAMQAAVATHGGSAPLLPALKRLFVSSRDREAIVELLRTVAGQNVCPRLQLLTLYAGGDVDVGHGLARALADGGFPCLQSLSLAGAVPLGESLAGVVQALAAAPCAKTLLYLNLGGCRYIDGDGGGGGGGGGDDDDDDGTVFAGIQALGAAFGAGIFPSLTTLDLLWSRLNDASVVAFAESLTAAGAPPLETLSLLRTGVGDAGIVAVANAFGQGSRLKELRFGGYERGDGNGQVEGAARITDAAAYALAAALQEGGYGKRLESLDLSSPAVTYESARHLLLAALDACPVLSTLNLHCRDLTMREHDELRCLVNERRVVGGRRFSMGIGPSESL
jgi:hypothetical protein